MPKSQEWIGKKISKLRKEGYKPRQAVAIGLRMAGVPPKKGSKGKKKK